MTENKLSEVSFVDESNQLRSLLLMRNKLKSLSGILGAELTSLNISYNSIYLLSAFRDIIKCPKLSEIQVEGNPVVYALGDFEFSASIVIYMAIIILCN